MSGLVRRASRDEQQKRYQAAHSGERAEKIGEREIRDGGAAGDLSRTTASQLVIDGRQVVGDHQVVAHARHARLIGFLGSDAQGPAYPPE